MTVALGCALGDQTKPDFVGPSELGLSLTITANPDTLSKDGSSQSLISVLARGSTGQPQSNVALRADIWCVSGDNQKVLADLGSLSARNLVTGSDGKAQMVYTAPATGGPLDSLCLSGIVFITLVPGGTNFANAIPREVEIRLVDPGVIVPPANLKASFTFSPSVPVDNEGVLFDGTTSTGSIASYSWNFGDGSTGTGATITHPYTKAGNYTATLTVQDSVGRAVSTSKQVTVGAGVNPLAGFTYSPGQPTAGQTVYFNASNSTAGAGRTIVAYDWDFGTGRTGTGLTTSKVYDTAGSYVVTLTVTDDVGRKGVTAQTVQVVGSGGGGGGGGAPVADFSFSPTTPAATQTVFFNAGGSTTPSGTTITAYAWDFGDGSAAATGATTSHAFAAAGTYVVRLTITNSAGQTATKTANVPVTSAGGGGVPVADFSYSPTAPAATQTVFFNAGGSTTPSGTTITAYAWDFGDGSTATGVSTSHAFAAAGKYGVRLTVTNSAGQTGTKVTEVTVIAAPVANFTFSPAAPAATQTVFFNASDSTTPSGTTITAYAWDFGDGSTATGVTTSHAFAAAGTYGVRLTVTNSAGQTGMKVTNVAVTSAGVVLTAAFNISPTDPTSGQMVSFNANTSSPLASITRFDWDFGDGTIVTNQTTPIINHTYFTVTGNTFNVRLTVFDSAGRSATITNPVTVKISALDPTARFTVSPSPAAVGATVTFDGSASSAVAPATLVRYEWLFGDGTPLTSTLVPTTTHVYGTAGTYVITLTVVDSSGRTASTTRTLVVQ